MKIVGFADDVVLMVIGESVEEVEVRASQAIEIIENWMRGKKLTLAHQKTEIMMISNRKEVQQGTITIGEVTIDSKRVVKHLGVMIDDRLNFNSHVDYTCEKATKAITALTRIMSNSSAIRSNKRRLLASVSTSILRYGAPAWAAGVITRRNLTRLNSTYRLMAMRVASAYRTISVDAVCVIAGMTPINILLEEDCECYRLRGTSGARMIARSDSMRKWQLAWNSSSKGRWTFRLIPNLSLWVNRKHGEVNFYLTQFLSGHGCFRKYLHRFGHAESPLCPSCPNCEETPEHVIFDCPRFRIERSGISVSSARDMSPDNIIQEMCKNENTWNEVGRAVTKIILSLQRKWREDQRVSDSVHSSTVTGELLPSGSFSSE